MRLWRTSESGNNPRRRGSDHENTYINWAVGVVGSAVVLGATLYVKDIAADAKDAKTEVALVSKEQAGTKEAVKSLEKEITDFKVEQRATNKEIKDTQQKALDLLIRMDGKNSR